MCGVQCAARRTYCSAACKQRAYRLRARARGGNSARARLMADIQYVRQKSETAADLCFRVLHLYGEEEAELTLDAIFHLLEVLGALD